MQELLSVPETQLIGESSSGGVLWAPGNAFAQVMGPKRHGCVCRVSFGRTSSGRKTRDIQWYTISPPLSHASDQKVTELET